MRDEQERVRLDKWLWAARFFKTRGLAADAIDGGHVQVQGNRVKPARPVHVGDILTIRRGAQSFTVEVKAISDHRGPAPVAQQLYEESEESRRERERLAEQQRFAAAMTPAPERRPDKRDRRRLMRFNDQQR